MAEHQDGQSAAAWTAVGLELLASLLICLAVVLKNWPMGIAGIVLVVLGAAAGKLLAMAGFGQDKPARPTEPTAVR